ncbi:hypothetical protein DXT90_07900 [Agrobacterium tumefaciens]|nr:hypothetical protein [Agrobacterium tumefaciens]
MTAAINWTGPSGTYEYALVRETSYNRQQAVNAEKLGNLLSQLDAPMLAALSSVEGLQDHLILLTGPSTLSLIPRTSLLEGVKRDQTVNTIADLATYSGEVKDFAVLVANAGGGRAAIFVKRSNSDGDWSDPVYITGAVGETGAPGPYTEITVGTTTTLPAGSPATVTPTVVDADTIRLDFGLPKGLDGTGTGDVIGPSSSVANRVAVFGGTTGKVIIDSGITLGSSASRNVGTTAGTVAAGDDPRFSAGGQNDAILALEIADLKGTRLGMKGGVADAFDDETGVATKTNATYDATNDWYAPTSAAGVRITGATPTTPLGGTPTNINDNTPSTTSSAAIGNLSSVADINARIFAKLDFGSVQSMTKIEAKALSFTAGGGSTFLGLYYSSDGTTWTQLGSNLSITTTPTDFTREGAFTARYVAVIFAQVQVSTTCVIGDLNAYGVGAISNMTLVSVAYPLASVPTTARMTLQTVEFDTATPNTDFVAEFSRDGGTTWTAANLTLSPYLVVGNYKMYEAQPFSVTGQPSGSSMKWQIRTLTNKNIAISGIVSQGN